jgi:hypothetical protein
MGQRMALSHAPSGVNHPLKQTSVQRTTGSRNYKNEQPNARKLVGHSNTELPNTLKAQMNAQIISKNFPAIRISSNNQVTTQIGQVSSN